MQVQPPRHDPTSATPWGDEDREYRNLMLGILGTVALVLAVSLLGGLVTGANTLARMGLLGVGALVTALSYAGLRISVRHGAAVLVVGLWLLTTAAVVGYAGVHSANMLTYAFLIALCGWILGGRWLLVVSSLTILVIVCVGLADYLGLFHPTPRAPVPVVAGTLLGALVGVSFLTAVAHQSLGARHFRAMALSEDLRRQNLELGQRERDLQLIMAHIPVGLTSIDKQLRFRFVNARYATTMGLTPQDLVGKSLADLIGTDQLPSLLPRWQACLAGEMQRYRREQKDASTGAMRIIEVAMVPEFDGQQVTGMFGVIQDVTDAVQAQESIRELNATLEQRVVQRSAQLQATMDKLQLAQEELSRAETQTALSTMIASVSHELSTPLGNSLITATTLVDQSRAFGELLQSQQIKRSDLQRFVDEVAEGNDLMQRNLRRAAELLKNFRQVANDQASEQRRDFDLAESVREVTQALAPSLKRQAHRLVLELPEGITMDSFPGALGQLVINLTNNAYLHAFEGMEQGTMTIRGQAEGTDVLLDFIDNGVGMSEAQCSHLFEPFFTTKKGKGGTGLGMSIAQSLVQKTLGGTIAVRSAPGQGTTIAVRLPRKAPGAVD